MPLVALTGATGFIGRHLLRELPKRGYRMRVLLRRPSAVGMDFSSAVVGDLANPQNMSAALADVDAVIHSAGLTGAATGAPEDDFRVLNTEATVALARAAARAGAKRFIYMSSIRAQSGATADGVVNEDREPRPTDAYGRSKLAAEQGLAKLEIDWVALRPVLVYGPGMSRVGHFAALMRFARSSYPLPLAAVTARRSLLSIDNLTDAIDTVLAATASLRRPYIVADADRLTVAEMLVAMRRGLNRRPNMFPVPLSLLQLGWRATVHTESYRMLRDSLVVDPSALGRLGWAPRITTPSGLAALMKS